MILLYCVHMFSTVLLALWRSRRAEEPLFSIFTSFAYKVCYLIEIVYSPKWNPPPNRPGSLLHGTPLSTLTITSLDDPMQSSRGLPPPKVRRPCLRLRGSQVRLRRTSSLRSPGLTCRRAVEIMSALFVCRMLEYWASYINVLCA